MRESIYKILWISVFLLVWIQPVTLKADMVMPQWQKGDIWQVKAIYSDPTQQKKWSEHIGWEYQIVQQITQGTKTFYTIRAKNITGRSDLTTELVYTKDSYSLSLTKADIAKTRRGKIIHKILVYEEGVPVHTEQSLIPYDMPVFPLILDSSKLFSITKPISKDLKTTEIFKQEVRQVLGIQEELPKCVSKLGFENEKLSQVKCIRKKDNVLIFVQYWHKDFPWPLVGKNKNMIYWLVTK